MKVKIKLGNIHIITILVIVCYVTAIVIDSYYGYNNTSVFLYTFPFVFIAGLIVYHKVRKWLQE